MSVAEDIVAAVQGIGPIAAGWYSAATNRPVIIPGSPEAIAAQYAAISAQNQARTQAALLQNQPTAAGLLNNPTVIILGLAAVVVVFVLLMRK